MTQTFQSIKTYLSELDLRRGYYVDFERRTFLVPRVTDAGRIMVSITVTDDPVQVWFQSAFELSPRRSLAPALTRLERAVAKRSSFGTLHVRWRDRAIVVVATLPVIDAEMASLQFRWCLDEFTNTASDGFMLCRSIMSGGRPPAERNP